MAKSNIAREPKRVEIQGPLSCILFFETPRGQFIESDLFAVPSEDYSAGWDTGRAVAAEFMQALQDRNDFDVLGVIEAASAVLTDLRERGGMAPTKDRRGAAVGFLRTLESFLRMAAERTDHQALIALERAQSAAFEAAFAARKTERKNEAVKRMQAGKVAKRQADDVFARLSKGA